MNRSFGDCPSVQKNQKMDRIKTKAFNELLQWAFSESSKEPITVSILSVLFISVICYFWKGVVVDEVKVVLVDDSDSRTTTTLLTENQSSSKSSIKSPDQGIHVHVEQLFEPMDTNSTMSVYYECLLVAFACSLSHI